MPESTHPSNAAADQWIDKRIECLDHGFVMLKDYMGSDAAIVQGARVSYGEGTKRVSEDKGLISHLMRNWHTSPFEMVELKFHVKLPIFVARQWIRHRTANVNESSARYSVMQDEFYVPAPEDVRFQGTHDRQGSSDEAVPEELRDRVLSLLQAGDERAFAEYGEMIEAGVARELARVHLPVSLYTEWYWKIDLHNLLHFLSLRLDSHAQYEIRVYAQAIARILKDIVPWTWEAFEEHRLHAQTFSRSELAVLGQLLRGEPVEVPESLLKGGRRREFEAKLRALGVEPGDVLPA